MIAAHKAAEQLWQRPVDVSRAIDAVMTQPNKFGATAKRRIAVVGHSLGGWTALEIAGARFDPQLFAGDCKAHPQLSSCKVYQTMNPASTTPLKTALASDLRDPRVSAVVTLDLGLSRGMTDQSLAALPVPALVIAAGAPSQDLPAELESADLAKRLPEATSRYVEIGDASHFSFLPTCKAGAVELLEDDAPGDGIICSDGDNAPSKGGDSAAGNFADQRFPEASGKRQSGTLNSRTAGQNGPAALPPWAEQPRRAPRAKK